MEGRWALRIISYGGPMELQADTAYAVPSIDPTLMVDNIVPKQYNHTVPK